MCNGSLAVCGLPLYFTEVKRIPRKIQENQNKTNVVGVEKMEFREYRVTLPEVAKWCVVIVVVERRRSPAGKTKTVGS